MNFTPQGLGILPLKSKSACCIGFAKSRKGRRERDEGVGGIIHSMGGGGGVLSMWALRERP